MQRGAATEILSLRATSRRPCPPGRVVENDLILFSFTNPIHSETIPFVKNGLWKQFILKQGIANFCSSC